MIEIDGKIVSTDILTERFLCDPGRCRGICCVEGNAGAPLEEDEALILAREWPAYKDCMTAEGVAAVERQGFAVVDEDGDLVTPLVGDVDRDSDAGRDADTGRSADEECAYSYNEGGVTLCAIEKAWAAGATTFRKPVSCHLYPIRVARFGDGTLGLNYHRWGVCEGARELGRERGVAVFRMLREAIVRRFGEEFFEALEAAERYIADHRPRPLQRGDFEGLS